jgi:hypothetical protein
LTVSAELQKSLETLELLTELVRSEANKDEIGFERLLDGYLEARRSLAKQFSEVAQNFLLRGDTLLETTRKRIEERMKTLFRGRIPDTYLVVHGYKGVHPVLLQYLAQHAGNPVRGSKLRVLVADQVHTERRVRDLRDLGFQVEWKKVSDEDQYVLASIEPDVDNAVVTQLRRNIKGDKKLSTQQKAQLLASIGA